MAGTSSAALLEDERVLVRKIQGYFCRSRPYNCVGFQCAPLINGFPIDGVHFNSQDGMVKTTVCLHTGLCNPLEEVMYFLYKLLATKRLSSGSWSSLFPTRERPGSVLFSEDIRGDCAGFSLYTQGEPSIPILQAGIHYDALSKTPFTTICDHKRICDGSVRMKYALMQACILIGGMLMDQRIDVYHFILQYGWLESLNRSGLAWMDFMLTPERWPIYNGVSVPGWIVWHPSTLFVPPSTETANSTTSQPREIDLSLNTMVKDFHGVKMVNLERIGWNGRRLFFSFHMGRESPRLVKQLAELWKSGGLAHGEMIEALEGALATLQ